MRKTIRAACISTVSASIITTACAAGFTAKDLAAYSVQHGMRAAFLEFFAAVDNGRRNHDPGTPAEVVVVWR